MFWLSVCLSLSKMSPVTFMPGFIEILSERRFKRDVFPAPDAPIIKVTCLGKQNPVTPLSTYNTLEGAAPAWISCLLARMVTSKRTSLKLILTACAPDSTSSRFLLSAWCLVLFFSWTDCVLSFKFIYSDSAFCKSFFLVCIISALLSKSDEKLTGYDC